MAQSGWVRRLAGGLLHDGADADDAAQDTLLAGLRRPPDQRGSLRNWLGTVLTNGLRTRARRNQRRTEREAVVALAASQSSVRTPEEIVSGLELQRKLAAELITLAEPFRQAVFMRYYDDLAPTEIARRLGVPAGTLRWRVKEGLDRLRARLDMMEPENARRWRALLLPGLPEALQPSTGAATSGATASAAVGGSAPAASGAGVAAITVAPALKVLASAVAVSALAAAGVVAVKKREAPIAARPNAAVANAQERAARTAVPVPLEGAAPEPTAGSVAALPSQGVIPSATTTTADTSASENAAGVSPPVTNAARAAQAAPPAIATAASGATAPATPAPSASAATTLSPPPVQTSFAAPSTASGSSPAASAGTTTETLSAPPRSPPPAPPLPRTYVARERDTLARAMQTIENTAVSLAGVTPAFASGVTRPLRELLGKTASAEIYPAALYYAIVDQAASRIGNRTAAQNLVTLHLDGSIRKFRTLPATDPHPPGWLSGSAGDGIVAEPFALPMPEPRLPREYAARDATDLARALQIIEDEVILAGVNRAFVAGITKPLSSLITNEGKLQIRPAALYYLILQEAVLGHGNKTAAQNLVTLHRDGIMLRMAVPESARSRLNTSGAGEVSSAESPTTPPDGTPDIVSRTPKSPIPAPYLPRVYAAASSADLAKMLARVERTTVELARVSRDYADGVTGEFARSVRADGATVYPVAMYYYIIREAALKHGKGLAARNLAGAQTTGEILKYKNLPATDDSGAGLPPAAAMSPANDPEAADGALTISTTPPAMIYIDEEPIGRSPLTRKVVQAGRHTVQARAPGFRPAEQEINVKPGQSITLVLPLVPETAKPPPPPAQQ